MNGRSERPDGKSSGRTFPSFAGAAYALGAAGIVVLVAGWGHGWGWFGAGLVLAGVMGAGLARSRRSSVRPAMRRYRERQALIMVVYCFALLGATWLYRHGLTDGPLGYVIAVVPALPILGVFVIMARALKEETDEMQREMLLTALVWSGGLTLSEATVWGFLETFRKAPHVWMWVVPVVFFAQLAITGPLAQRKYR